MACGNGGGRCRRCRGDVRVDPATRPDIPKRRERREKLLIRFASLPCFPQGSARVARARRWSGRASPDNRREPVGEFQHGGLMGRYHRWERMAARSASTCALLLPRAGDVLAHAHLPVERSPAVRRDGEGEQSREGVRGPAATWATRSRCSSRPSSRSRRWRSARGAGVVGGVRQRADPAEHEIRPELGEARRMRGCFSGRSPARWRSRSGWRLGRCRGWMERDPTMHEDGGWVHAWGGLRSRR